CDPARAHVRRDIADARRRLAAAGDGALVRERLHGDTGLAGRVLREPRVRADGPLASRLRVRGGGSPGRRRDHGRLSPPARTRAVRGIPRRNQRRADRRLQLGRKPARIDARARRARGLMQMIDIPVIETERLHLTALAERHFEAYASMLADSTSTRYVGDGEPLDRMN